MFCTWNNFPERKLNHSSKEIALFKGKLIAVTVHSTGSLVFFIWMRWFKYPPTFCYAQGLDPNFPGKQFKWSGLSELQMTSLFYDRWYQVTSMELKLSNRQKGKFRFIIFVKGSPVRLKHRLAWSVRSYDDNSKIQPLFLGLLAKVLRYHQAKTSVIFTICTGLLR